MNASRQYLLQFIQNHTIDRNSESNYCFSDTFPSLQHTNHYVCMDFLD